MRPTLRSVLASPTLREGRPEVLAGADRLDAPVRWVHVAEVRELSALLQGGELILTTGIAMAGPPEDAAAYVEELHAAGAVGLVVELGERLPDVPAPAVDAARRGGLPLVVLHRRVRFVDVTEQVHRAIVAEQLEQVEFARAVHEEFTRLSLENADAARIVEAAAARCGSSVVLEDLSRHVVAFSARGRPTGSLLADWDRRSRSARVLEGTGVTGDEGWVTAPVGLRGHRWGRLVVPDPQTEQARLAMVLERAAQALELGRMVERDRLRLELQAQGGLLAELAAGRTTEADAVARAAALGVPPAPRWLPLAVRHATAPGAAGERDLLERLSRTLRDTRAAGLVGPLGAASAGVLLAVPGAPSAAGEATVLTALVARLDDEALRVGVGPAGGGLVDAGAGLRLADHVAEVAASLPGPRQPWYRASDVRLHGLLALLHDDPRVQAFMESELGPLLEHRARGGSDLLEVLRQYVAAGGNKTRLAASAHRSRAAVYKKLARIERLLGVDLDDPASLLSLGVAVLVHDQAARRTS